MISSKLIFILKLKATKWLAGFCFLCALVSMLSACAATDPSVNDLKSPCVSADVMSEHGVLVPCERRRPVQNYTYIVS